MSHGILASGIWYSFDPPSILILVRFLLTLTLHRTLITRRYHSDQLADKFSEIAPLLELAAEIIDFYLPVTFVYNELKLPEFQQWLAFYILI